MQGNTRHERDSFQILTNKVSSAIQMYLYDMSQEVVIDNVHAAHSILMDLSAYYSGRNDKKTKRSSPARTITEPDYFSRQLESARSEKYFRRRKVDGKAGLYAHLGNSVKHADSDPEALIAIYDQHAFEYLYALVRDYRQLKDALLDAGIIKVQPEFIGRKDPNLLARGAISLRNQFMKEVGMSIPKTPLPRPMVDIASDIFLGWTVVMDNFFANIYRKKGLEWRENEKFWDIGNLPNLENSEKKQLNAAVRSALSEAGRHAMTYYLTRKLGMLSEEEYAEFKKNMRLGVREYVRTSSKASTAYILQERIRRYDWSGTGYYLDVDGRAPVYPSYAFDENCYEYPPSILKDLM